MFDHTSLALKLNVQNANGSTIDALATTSYVKKGKQARIQEKQTINVTLTLVNVTLTLVD